jgi:biopolymer transport protein ExbD
MAFGQLGNNSPPQPLSEINMTPLVDAMLVLLMIFIVTAPLLTHSVKVNLPKANAGTQAINNPIVVSLNQDLQLFLNKMPVSMEVLANELRTRASKGEPPNVELHTGGDIAYQHVVRLLALIQDAGITKLSSMTEPIKVSPVQSLQKRGSPSAASS